jgi:hypothetical protein
MREIFIITVVKCKQSHCLTYIRNTKNTITVPTAKKQQKKKNVSDNWPMCNILETVKEHTKKIKEIKIK